MGSKQKHISKNSVGRLNLLAGVVMSLLVLLAGFYIFSSKSNAEVYTLNLSSDASYTSQALSLYSAINLNGHHLTVTNDFSTDAPINLGEGGKLTVNGNMTTSNSLSCEKQSTLEVKGNYEQTDGYFFAGLISVVNISGNMSFTSTGYPSSYGEESASLTIGGDFIYDTKSDGYLMAKTLLSGNVTQDKEAKKINIKNLNLTGKKTQTITVFSGEIQNLTSTNTDIILNGKLNGTKLQSDIILKPTDKADFSAVTILEGNKLTVNGDMNVSGFLDCAKESTLEVNGNYKQTDGYFYAGLASVVNISGNMSFTSTGYPSSYGEESASLTIGGDFIYDTKSDGFLMAKTLLSGNVTQDKEAKKINIKNLNLTGKDTQTVTLPNGTITKLTLAAGKSHYTFTKADCYEKLIATSEVIFDADGGTVDTAKKNVTTEEKYGELPAPTKDGCVFDGWVIKDTDTVITSETVVTAVDDHTLVALWKKETDDEGSPMYMDGKNCSWNDVGGKSYWYENGVKQGTYYDPKGVLGDGTVRGREICDTSLTDDAGQIGVWFWLDSVYHGAKAVGKEVWIPYIYQDEDSWDDAAKKEIAQQSDPGMGDLVYRYMKDKNGKWVRYDQNGRMLKSWVKIEGALAEKYPDQVGNTYYYDTRTGLMAKGLVTIDGVEHFFNEVSGVLEW